MSTSLRWLQRALVVLIALMATGVALCFGIYA